MFLFLCTIINGSGSCNFFPLCLSRCLFVRLFSLFLLFVYKNLNVDYNVLMVSGKAFIFHMCIPRGKTVSLAPISTSSVKVKVIFCKKMAVSGAFCVSAIHHVKLKLKLKQNLVQINLISNIALNHR